MISTIRILRFGYISRLLNPTVLYSPNIILKIPYQISRASLVCLLMILFLLLRILQALASLILNMKKKDVCTSYDFSMLFLVIIKNVIKTHDAQ